MSVTISSIHYCPVKSVSFQSIKNCEIKKNIGIVGDRIFAFAKGLNFEQAKLFEKDPEERRGKWNKILELENSLKDPIILMKNEVFPFYDTSISKKTVLNHSISLINNKSIEDFKNKINQEIEIQRFRGNIYISGIDAWEEQNWIGKIIKINDISFKVEKKIPRCVAINLKPNSDDKSLNLLQSLKKNYNHFDMGIYLTALNDGQINIGEKISF